MPQIVLDGQVTTVDDPNTLYRVIAEMEEKTGRPVVIETQQERDDHHVYSDLEGKVAIVTGGRGDFGKHIIAELAKWGVHGAVVDHPSQHASTQGVAGYYTRNSDSLWVPYDCDVTKKDMVDATAAAVHERFGRIDFLVNNAGLIRRKTIMETAAADGEGFFYKMMGVNVYGGILFCAAVVPYMEKNELEDGRGNVRGKVLNMSSNSGVRTGQGFQVYCETKRALIVLTEGIVQEHGKDGILSYALAPDIFPSDGWNFMEYADVKGLSYKTPAEARRKVIAYYQAKIPLNRVGALSEIGYHVTHLLSRRGDFQNGSVVELTGGRHL